MQCRQNVTGAASCLRFAHVKEEVHVDAASGAVLWDIAGLAAGTTIDIPAYAQPTASGTDLMEGKYQITTWSLFNPGSSSVPDGRTTVALLGAVLSGLALIRRKLS
jgi:VPDSG-CTERM motif